MALQPHHQSVVVIVPEILPGLQDVLTTEFPKDSVMLVTKQEAWLSAHGLHFFRNVKAEVCDGKITSWAFFPD